MYFRPFIFACFIILGMSFCNSTQAQLSFAEHSVLRSGTWHRIDIDNDGIYKITSSDLPSLKGATCQHIGIWGGTGDKLNENRNGIQLDDLQPIGIQVADLNGNGVFDSEDYLLFYAEGPHVWRYNSSSNRFEYRVHPYANHNCYYITTSGGSDPTTIATTNLNATDNTPISHYTAVAVRNIDHINAQGGGQIWAEEKFSSSITNRNYTLSLPNTPLNNSVSARFGLGHSPNGTGMFTLRCGNNESTQSFYASGCYRETVLSLSNITGRDLTFQISYSPSSASSEGYFDYLELNANVPLTYSGGQITFRNREIRGDGSASTFLMGGTAYNTQVWDVTNPTNPSSLTLTGTGSSQFQFVAPSSRPGTFVIFTPSDAFQPVQIVPLNNQDIHGATLPDYVIVSHSDFMDQAQRLADLHHSLEGLNVLVVSQEQVYNEFNSGKPDPVAMRKMMQCLRHKDSEGVNPRYLLYFGKGTYDNRNILGKSDHTVVTYQTLTSFEDEGASFPSDDVAGYLDTNCYGLFEGNMSVSIGRLPAKSVNEATHFVDKIERYMNNSDFDDPSVRGDWRNYVALLADDADPSCPYDSVFASDSEKTARLIKEHYPHFNIDKIFADSYIQQSGADGSYYPDVNNALRQRMNYGCLLLNYIGHGSSSYIGTERFVEFTDIERYSNTNRLPLFVTSTCSYGHYDLVDDNCGAEAFLLAEGGAIGVIAAARPIHHTQTFNTNACLFALDPDNTIGDALRRAKNATQVSHCIALMGDPALHLSLPHNDVVVTAINGQPIDTDVTDSAEVLSRVTVEGEIRNSQGLTMTDFNGTIFPIVFDREVACRTLANDNDSTEVNFVQQKNILYKGRETVTDGRFSYSFIVPRDVAYRYDYAKLSHYAQSANDNATGQYSNIMFGGFNEDMEIAELHPTVELFFGDTNFRNGGITNETPTLYARMRDSVGINAAGSGLGHDITAIIDGNPYSTVTLNDYFEPDIYDSRNGSVVYTLGKLDNGPHTLTVKCWNIFNYSGSQTIDFVVANDRKAQIGQLTTAPNPAHDRTTIRLEHNLPGSITNATINIYDMRGRLIRQFTPDATNSECVIAIPWNFTDEGGQLLPAGIYIMRATITTHNGDQLIETAKVVRY